MLRHASISATGTLSVATGGGQLWSINVNTGAPSAVLRIYDEVSAVAAALIATIDCSAANSWWYGCLMPKGITAVLSGGNADVTIGYR